MGRSMSVSRVPGAAPRTSTPPTPPHSHNTTVQPVAALPGVRELHIGHAIVSRAVFVGMRAAVTEMKRLLREAAANSEPADSQ